jgi:signal transduction histidine kinase
MAGQVHRARFQMIIMLFMLNYLAIGQPLSFRKINSGTKSDILAIKEDEQQGVYFLTDKIYTLDKDTWKKLYFPVEGKISTFSPVSAQDIWFTVTQVTSTSILYHYHDGIIENIRTPFSNFISSIYFISGKSALFASYADMAVFENGSFKMLPPLPDRHIVWKLFAEDVSTFWVMSGNRELYRYDQDHYEKVPGEKPVSDFCFADMQDGYVLSSDELYRVDGSGVKLILQHPDLSYIRSICLLENGTVLMVGDKGLILSYSAGILSEYDGQCAENLTELIVTGSGEVWICGEGGRLLYSGEKQFPEYVEDKHGFSSNKLIMYGISTDDEYGVAMADFTGDEQADIYAVRIYEQNRLYINNLALENKYAFQNGFSEEAVKRNAIGVIDPENSSTLSELKLGIGVADIDNDNDQDIYLCYLNSVNKLLLNNGTGYFRNVSEQEGRACENMKRSNSAAFADVDSDGDLDLFVTNEEGSNRLFENDGTGHFSDITGASGLESTGGGMCASFADVNNDGYPDLCVTFWYPSNKLYINESENGKIHFRDVTHLTDLAGAVPSKSNAVAFADVNNDGFTDLFIANRNTANKLYLNDGTGIFTDKTADFFQPENLMSNGAVFADFDLDGYQDLYVTNVGENVLYKNDKGKGFSDVTALFGAELSGYCTGCAAGDVDNDGDPDLYVANYINGNSSLFLNNTEKANFVKFTLHGTRSNKDAIGAKVWLYKVPDGKQQVFPAGYRELNAGSGYGSVSAKEMIFGVEQDAHYYALVKFPSTTDTIRINNIVAGKTLEINELTGFAAFYTEGGNRIVRFFTDREEQPEIVKYLLIILLLAIYNLKLRRSTRNIALFRWLASGFIFIIFCFVNLFFLFKWPSVTFFIAPLIALGFLALLDLFTGRILLRRLAQKEKLDLREKLSRDLHDDLASTLGSISIYAETLKGMDEPSQSDFKKLSVKIAGLTQSALQSISDIIWMTSPRNDSLQSLISKTSNYMLEILTDNHINFSAVIEIPDNPVILKENIRNDAFLILKEGLHNIIRHSGARNVEFKATLAENVCFIRLKDDGVGIDDSKPDKKGSHGNGLVNMRRRAQESDITFSLQSSACPEEPATSDRQKSEGSGVEIILQFKI